jgi:methylmalonyl-CoA mutase C-terminal domain/subunit
LSILSNAHGALFPRIVELLTREGRSDILLFAGGIFPDEDVLDIKRLGFRGVFGPGSDTRDIAAFIRTEIAARGPVRG